MNILRGFKDLLCYETNKKKKINNFIKYIYLINNFYEIETPILENFEIFNKKNNIFINEVFKFFNYGKKLICLRPENTTNCIRIFLKYNKKLKIFYSGPIFRYEKPQLNKMRQFNQFGFEIYNNKIFKELNSIKLTNKILLIFDNYKLEINSFFNYKFKMIYLIIIIYFIEKKFLIKIKKKVLLYKILENLKFKFNKFIFNYKFINLKKKNQLKNFFFFLKTKIIFNPNLLRGINYYSNLIFEWKNSKNSVCGGGNYSYYLSKILNKTNFSFGLAIGLERLYFKKKYNKKKFKINSNINLNIKNIFLVSKFENIKIYKINNFIIKFIVKKKQIIFSKKKIIYFLKLLNNEKYFKV
ncbi:ATP phosphoribosyltransferase regulatory subunit [Candidatus Carsonella ruddii]|uniref:Histidine--tRNA ligase n=1 Tax=Candidatus Carsonella ruddii PC isolate NHV TaxID=1202540 RepID=J3TWQ2_CARRU|nr:ATP phosphoribosyltransferase regulatory subunit [Candidatus Carsonella ruddii]AFP84400.1 histidyl-tRNA synthetase [Candidatus Carsonella ruddii PC isolate NHV]